jgi:23S rRNA G2445 N2-methylase RlmL
MFDDLYAASVVLPWEQWLSPEKTFAITETVKHVDWLRNSHFAAIRLKDAIVDVSGPSSRPTAPVDTDNPDVVFHVHMDGEPRPVVRRFLAVRCTSEAIVG